MHCEGELLLMLDYGVFYEFIPLEEVGASAVGSRKEERTTP